MPVPPDTPLPQRTYIAQRDRSAVATLAITPRWGMVVPQGLTAKFPTCATWTSLVSDVDRRGVQSVGERPSPSPASRPRSHRARTTTTGIDATHQRKPCHCPRAYQHSLDEVQPFTRTPLRASWTARRHSTMGT